MKISSKIVCVAMACIVWGCASSGGSKTELNTSIANAEKKILSVDKFTELHDDALKELSGNGKADNLIIFIHGRGKHPEKAYKKALIADLEDDYSAKVIMFHWPSWNGLTGFPESNARNSANDFNLLLSQLRDYKNANKELIKNIKFTLLTHSMGSIVLEEATKNSPAQINNLFDTVLISASASEGKGHAAWVNKLDISDNVYITINEEDPMLGPAGAKESGRRLGKGLESRSGQEFALAQNAIYVDLTESSLGHRYYIHRDLVNKPVAKAFFDDVLNGHAASFSNGKGVREIRSERIYILRKNI